MTENQAITKQETSIVKSKLDKILERRTQSQQAVLILDTSGSMSSPADSPGERRIDALRGVVAGLRQRGILFRQLLFNTTHMWSDVITEPDGGTNMSGAFDFVAEINPKHIVIVSDGEPDNREAALASAKKLNCKIDVFFVGPKTHESAQAFMRELAELTGGSAQACSFAELENKVAGILQAGTAEDIKRGPIVMG